MHYNPHMNTRLKPGILSKVLIPVAGLILFGALLSTLTSSDLLDPLRKPKQADSRSNPSLALPEPVEKQQESSLLEKEGLEALASGDPGAAISLLIEAYQLSILSDEGWLGLGDAYQELGEIDQALAAWRNLPPSQDLYIRLTGAYHTLEDFEGLLSDLRKLLTHYPQEASLYFQTGLVYAAIRPDSAFAFLEQALSLDAKYQEPSRKLMRTIRSARLQDEPAYTYVASGRELASLDHWILALEAFRQALLIREDYAEAWAFYGEALQQAGRQEGIKRDMDSDRSLSLAALQKAVQLDPQTLSAQFLLSLYWQRQGKYEEAIAVLENAAVLEPANPMVWAELGSCWAQAGDLIIAQAYYQKALDLAPQDPFFWRLLADFSLTYHVQIRELGLPAARQAVLLEPNAPDNLTLLGQTLYFLGDHANAEKFLSEALDKDPTFSPAYLHLGLNYLMQGESEQAKAYLQKAVEYGPKGPTSEQARRILERHFP
jgi:tetratricopeptide (TPR) repeat protein